MFKALSVGALALALAACGAPRPRPAAPQNREESASRPGLPAPGRVYRIDEAQSELRILVYRAGALARFGHNHVLVNRMLGGEVSLADPVEASSFRLHVPAAGFVVDDADARREEGPDFAAEVTDDAKSGTRLNMLGTAVLDADEFPMIAVRSVAVAVTPSAGTPTAGTLGAPGAGAPSAGTPGTPDSGTPGAAMLIATVAISLTGHDTVIDVPLTLRRDSQQLSATGSLELRQSAVGVTPFSLMLGALQVQDLMRLKFKIVAVAQAGD